jgi:hypothetical protein
MSEPLDPEAWALLHEAAGAVDPVPEEVTELARSALDLVDGLASAAIVFDSWAEEDAPSLRSGADGVRVLEYTDGDRLLEVELQPGREPAATGQIDPPTGEAVIVETTGGEAARSVVGGAGTFAFVSLPAGPVRFVVLDGGDRLLQSAWTALGE